MYECKVSLIFMDSINTVHKTECKSTSQPCRSFRYKCVCLFVLGFNVSSKLSYRTGTRMRHHMWRQFEEKYSLWRRRQCFPRSAFPIYVFIFTVWFLNCAESEKSVFCRSDVHMWQKDQALIRRRSFRACSLCPSISRFFTDDVIYSAATLASLCRTHMSISPYLVLLSADTGPTSHSSKH